MLHDSILKIMQTSDPLRSRLQGVCQYMHENDQRYTWVGFYFMNDAKQTLHLGPCVGAPTEHEVIPYGKGICGQVAASGEYYLSNDVAAEANYIACSLDVRSEIVVPIYVKNKLIAQLDIDSNVVGAFSENDREELEQIADLLANEAGAELLLLQEKIISQA